MKRITPEQFATNLFASVKEASLSKVEVILKTDQAKKEPKKVFKELCFFERFAADLALFLTKMLDNEKKQRVREAYMLVWTNATETQFRVSDDEANERLSTYGQIAQQGFSPEKFGIAFSKFCSPEGDMDTMVLGGLMFSDIFKRVTEEIQESAGNIA